VVEPGAFVHGAIRLQAEQVVDRPLEPERRRMPAANRGKSLSAGEADHGDLLARLVEQRQMHHLRLAEQAEQHETSL
jgi:hypothetical protein